jgi:hypothetical protein
MKTYEIYIAYVAWDDDGKKRPILYLRTEDGMVSAFKITTKFDKKSSAIKKHYYKIKFWRKAGLLFQSYVDTTNMVEIPTNMIVSPSPIGKLAEYDKKALVEFLSKKK